MQSSSEFLESTDLATTSAPNKVVQSNGAGKIDSSWIGSVPFTALPVAASGEVSDVKVVPANDPRLGNPTLAGDVTGTAGSNTVEKLRGRTISGTAPSEGQALVWSHALNQWIPSTVGGDAGNATQIQGRAIATTQPNTGEALIWNGTQWAPAPGGGGGGEDEYSRVAAVMYLSGTRPFG